MKLLDHGSIELVTSWGSDEAIVEAARMSTGRGFVSWDPYVRCRACSTTYLVAGDKHIAGMGCEKCLTSSRLSGNFEHFPKGDLGLLTSLYRAKHATPFEMAGATFEVQAPIFVFREWHRHRTQSYNEMSARYTPLPDLDYVPTVERLMQRGGTNKQAQSTGAELTESSAEGFRWHLQHMYRRQQELYEWALREGVPKELARVHLPFARYSRMRASTNLRNWMQFLTLRCAPAAQWEIRQYAQAALVLLRTAFPRVMSIYDTSTYPCCEGVQRIEHNGVFIGGYCPVHGVTH